MYNILSISLSISLRVQSKCGSSSITSNLILFSFSKKKKKKENLILLKYDGKRTVYFDENNFLESELFFKNNFLILFSYV